MPLATTARKPRHRLLLALGLGSLLLVGGFALGEVAGWPWLAGPLERRLSDALQRPMRLLPGQGEALRIRLLGRPQLDAGLLQIDDSSAVAGGVAGRPLLELRQLRLVLRWSDLFALARGSLRRESDGAEPLLHIEELSAQGLRLQARRDAQGRANWVFAAADPAAPQRPALQLQFGRLLLGEAEGSVIDIGQTLELGFKLRMQSPPPQGQPALRAEASGRWRGQPFEAQLQAASAMPLIDAGSREPVALQLQLASAAGTLRFDGQAVDLLAQRALSGRLEVQGRSLAGLGQLFNMTLPATPAYRLQAELQHAQQEPPGVWQVAVHKASVGGSDLQGALRFDARPLERGGRGRLSGTLRSQRMRLADLGPAVGAGTPPAAQGGRVLPQRSFDLPSLRAMDADVRFDIARLELKEGGAEVRPLAPLAARLRLDDGLLRLDELQAGLALGRLTGAMSLDARKAGKALWDADLRLAQLQLERWLPAVRERAVPWVSGRFSGALQLKGRGRSTAELLASADGQLALVWQQGAISSLALEAAGLDIAQGLGWLLRGDKALPVRCGVAMLRVADGHARPAPVVIDTSDTTLWMEGEVSLADERLNLRLLAAPRDRSLLTLRSPLRLSGSLGDPQIGLQGGKLAQRLVPSVLLALINPAAALLPLLDAGDRDQARGAAEACTAAYQRAVAAATGPARKRA